MLIGEYYSKIGDKNRTALPKNLRDDLEGSIYITRGYEKALIILDEARWQRLLQIVETRPFLNRTVRDTKRFLAGGAKKLDLDVQGRFIIPENLIEYGNIKNDLVFVGILDWIELWDLDMWKTKINDLSENSAEIAEKLAA